MSENSCCVKEEEEEEEEEVDSIITFSGVLKMVMNLSINEVHTVYSLSPSYANNAFRKHSRISDFRVSRISRFTAKIYLIDNYF